MNNDAAGSEILHEQVRLPAPEEATVGGRADEDIVDFTLDKEGYSIPARFVREIRPLGSYTPLPALPPFVLGQVDVRGQPLPVLDLRPLLHRASALPCLGAVLLIVSANGIKAGLLADAVMTVRRNHSILVGKTFANRHVTWVRGIDRDHNVWLDPPQLLAEVHHAIGNL